MHASSCCNILSVDLEDYFMVSAFEAVVKREDWEKYESRVERNTYRLLDILSRRSRDPGSAICNPVRATFFCLGWVAERHPGLIRDIQRRGHEIACHGYDHRLVYHVPPNTFREDVRKSKKILEDIIGEEVRGYRAPSYSITDRSPWAFGILAEEGFKYDSSIFPIRHDFYGLPKAPRFPFIISLDGNSNVEFVEITNLLTHSLISSKSLIEFPISTVKLFGQNFPVSGGGYFRLFPYSFVNGALKRINKKEDKPFIFYLHPWELDPGQPRVNGLSSRSKFRHYVNLGRTEIKFIKLLEDFQFSTIRQFLIQNSKSKIQDSKLRTHNS